jgi:hypothetical protein
MASADRPGLSSLKKALTPLTRRLSWITPTAESDLRYTVLPPYEIPNLIVITGLLVENRGDKDAQNVSIEIRYDGNNASKIHHMQVMSDERYVLRGGGEEHDFAMVRLRRMSPGSKVFVYMATSEAVTPQIDISSFSRK